MDPFCGSCSLLLSAAHYCEGQCECIGSDADASVMEKQRDIATMFEKVCVACMCVYVCIYKCIYNIYIYTYIYVSVCVRSLL
jgi:hypothetical protein